MRVNEAVVLLVPNILHIPILVVQERDWIVPVVDIEGVGIPVLPRDVDRS